MKPLTIELVNGQKQEFTFLGWKDDGLSFFATRMDGQPAVITPVSAYPHDSNSGEPYRFPRFVPLTISPERFEIAWSDHHRDVLRRWRDAKLAEVEAEVQRTISLFDALKVAVMDDKTKQPSPRTQTEIIKLRREYRESIEFNFKTLMETPLVELFDPILHPGALADFVGKWESQMGADFAVMVREMAYFNGCWHQAYDAQGEHTHYQRMLSAFGSVRFVMWGNDGMKYHLLNIKDRTPTDGEAQAYVRLKQLLGGDILPKQIDDITNRAAATLAAAGEKLTKAGQQARADTEGGAATLAAAGDHVETKSGRAAQTLRQARKDLQATLDELEKNQARLEAVVEEYKLKENPRQTRRALANHGVSKRIADFILEHLIRGKPVPKAPTAARELQNKYATADGLDRKTVDRHYQKALPILRAAGWPELLLPTSKAADSKAADISCASEVSPKAHDPNAPKEPVTMDDVVNGDSKDAATPFERIQEQEHGRDDQT